jgi:UDP-glucose 4-epimerase
MQAWIFRFANIVGARSQRGVLYDLINKLKHHAGEMQILGNGTQAKPYLHIRDCVDGILFGCEHANEQVNLLNLGCRSSTSVADIAEMVVRALQLQGVKTTYTGEERGWRGDVTQVRYDVSRMERLGWRPKLESSEAVWKAIGEMLAE